MCKKRPKPQQSIFPDDNKNTVSRKKTNVLVLLSGGIDSAACVAFYLKNNFSVSALFFDYGQLSGKMEYKAAQRISRYNAIPLERIRCIGLKQCSGGYIPGRNAFLLQGALMSFKHNSGLIAVGIHSGTAYYDCSDKFIQSMQSLFNMYTDGRVSIDAPFLSWNKRQIWDFCQNENVPLRLTYSCELGKVQPCGQCLSCKDLEALLASQKHYT